MNVRVVVGSLPARVAGGYPEVRVKHEARHRPPITKGATHQPEYKSSEGWILTSCAGAGFLVRPPRDGCASSTVNAVLEDPNALLAEFVVAARAAGLGEWSGRLDHECLKAPHSTPRFRHCPAVYVFSLSPQYGSQVPAGANRVLKVGKVGANSAARFTSQHYLPNSAMSNLAKSLLTERVLWPFLGINELTPQTVRAWMFNNLERDHVFVPVDAGGLARDLERYLRGRLGPVFEG